MNTLLKLMLFILLVSCSTTYKNQNLVGKQLLNFKGKSLADKQWNIPSDLKGKKRLLLFGYKQNTQFDIDRWLIGIDMRKVNIDLYEIPAIQGFFPRLFAKKIDRGMQSGIPSVLWENVITVYEDGEKVQKFTGNENGLNARVVLIDSNGKIRFFHDQGFSTIHLNKLIKAIQETP